MSDLRPYQLQLFERVLAAYRGGARAICLQMGTGAGKTHTAAHFLDHCTARGYQSLFLAHLDTLIEDTHERLVARGVHAGFIQAGRPSSPDARVQVCSTPTLHRRSDDLPPAQVIVVDECHRAPGATVRALLERYPHAKILGLTATPQRGDGKALDMFDHIERGPSVKWLTSQGFLVPADIFGPDAYSERALVLDPVAAYQEHAPGTRALVFATNIVHARQLEAGFNAAGYTAALVLGETPRSVRNAVRARIRSGELQVLIGVGVFIEGWDEPSIETIVQARGFGVLCAYLQGIGRGLRPFPGKRRCTVIDCKGSIWLHGFPDEDRNWTLDGKTNGRSTEPTIPLRRCGECLAIFKTQASCPRCGARTATSSEKIPRTLSRAQKLQNLSRLAPGDRDRRLLEQLCRVAHRRGDSDDRATKWALRKFRERFGRDPLPPTAPPASAQRPLFESPR